jgi:hypothetical protein
MLSVSAASVIALSLPKAQREGMGYEGTWADDLCKYRAVKITTDIDEVRDD